jgi:hypothetical protein
MAELRYVDWDGLVYYDGKVKQYIADKLEDCIKMGGTVLFKDLPDPSFGNVNYIYKIEDEFVANKDFDNSIRGLVFNGGTWVQVTDIDSVYLYTIFSETDITPVGPGGVDLNNYYTKTQVDSLIASLKNEIPEVPTKVSDLENDLGYLTEHQDLSEYAKKSDIPQPELFVIDYNSPNFADAFDAYTAGKLLLLTNVAPDVDSYAIMNYVRSDMITFTKFLMSRSGTYGAFNTYYLRSDNTWEVAKEVKLNKVEAKVDDNNNISEIVIGKDTYDFDNFATTEVVNQINENVQNIENTYVTNETLQNNYVSNTYITENYTTNEQLEATYVTNEKVTEVVTQEVNTVVTEQIETKVTEVIQEKVDAGEITVQSDSISYDTWE